METIGKLTVFIVFIICAFFSGLLNTHIILDISNLYELKFITQFSFVQVYGVIILIGIITYKKQKKEEKEYDFAESMVKGFSELFTKIIGVLCIWGLSYITYNIIS
jgi:hypothetical protein